MPRPKSATTNSTMMATMIAIAAYRCQFPRMSSIITERAGKADRKRLQASQRRHQYPCCAK
jgi:hypothetical protein